MINNWVNEVVLCFTGVPSESNLKVMSYQGHLKVKLAKTVTMITCLFQSCSNFFFLNVSSLKGA